MTVAIDKVSGRVVGQAIASAIVEGVPSLRLLTAEGYCYVPRESVRLEETE